MQLAVHSHAFHYTIVALVILDAIIVLLEFLLDLGAFGRQVPYSALVHYMYKIFLLILGGF